MCERARLFVWQYACRRRGVSLCVGPLVELNGRLRASVCVRSFMNVSVCGVVCVCTQVGKRKIHRVGRVAA